MNKPEDKKQDKVKDLKKEYPENGENFKAGKEETGALPNNPAENAERTSPEEDKDKADKKQDKN